MASCGFDITMKHILFREVLLSLTQYNQYCADDFNMAHICINVSMRIWNRLEIPEKWIIYDLYDDMKSIHIEYNKRKRKRKKRNYFEPEKRRKRMKNKKAR
jgi:hypothetical protein